MDFEKLNISINRNDFFDNWISLCELQPIVNEMRRVLVTSGNFFDDDKEHVFQNANIAVNIAEKMSNLDAIQIPSNDPPDFILRFKDNSKAKFEVVEALKDYPRNRYLKEMWRKYRYEPHSYNKLRVNEIEAVASIRRALNSKIAKKDRYEGKNLNLAIYVNLSYTAMLVSEDFLRPSIVAKIIKKLSPEVIDCMKIFNDIIVLWSDEIYFTSEIIPQSGESFSEITN